MAVVEPYFKERERKGLLDQWNMIVFTNYPDHYADGDEPDEQGYWVAQMGNNPLFFSPKPEAMSVIHESCQKHWRLPQTFEEM